MKTKMHHMLMGFCILCIGSLLLSTAAIAAECSGSWQTLPNYKPGQGGACAAIGLNTHQAVCQGGQRYATYCDDASGGRYRTCQSNIPCGDDRGRRDSRDRYDDRDSRDYRDYPPDQYRRW
jgi:hypothetical protein